MKHVLIADDTRFVRELIAGALIHRGDRCTCVGDGVEAIAAMQRERFDLLISDMEMPNLSGLGLLRRLRADPSLPQLPVIILTGAGQRELAIETLKLGVRDYLLKNTFILTNLLERVK